MRPFLTAEYRVGGCLGEPSRASGVGCRWSRGVRGTSTDDPAGVSWPVAGRSQGSRSPRTRPPSQAQRDVSGDNQPGPAVGLLGVHGAGVCPAECSWRTGRCVRFRMGARRRARSIGGCGRVSWCARAVVVVPRGIMPANARSAARRRLGAVSRWQVAAAVPTAQGPDLVQRVFGATVPQPAVSRPTSPTAPGHRLLRLHRVLALLSVTVVSARWRSGSTFPQYSSVVVPRPPRASIWAWRSHFRGVSGFIPYGPAMGEFASYSEA